jgi:hypothetical protein
VYRSRSFKVLLTGRTRLLLAECRADPNHSISMENIMKKYIVVAAVLLSLGSGAIAAVPGAAKAVADCFCPGCPDCPDGN